VDGESIRLEGHDDRAVPVRPEHPGTGPGQPLEGCPGRVAVRVARAGGCDRDPRPDGVDERLGGRRPAAVVGDLEQIDTGQVGGQQLRVDRFLHVPHQQEPSCAHLPSEHH